MATIREAWYQRRYLWHEWILDNKHWDEMGASDLYVAAMEFYDRRLVEEIEGGKAFGINSVDSSMRWLAKDFEDVYAEWETSPEFKRFYPDA